MRIYSWNVNGIRSCAKKGLAGWLASAKDGIVGLQEVRASEAQVPPEVSGIKGLASHVVAAERPGYSGVGLFSATKPDDVETSLGKREFDAEGRVQVARFGKLYVVNVYVPNGGGKERDNSRIPYKLEFSAALFKKLEKLRAKKGRVLVMGDFNVAHKDIDIARPKENVKTAGFTPEERAEMTRWLDAGWIDSFRAIHGDKPAQYSWWSQRGGARERNVGWRIDYVLASEGAMDFVTGAAIHPDVHGSDHCPVSVDVKDSIMK